MRTVKIDTRRPAFKAARPNIGKAIRKAAGVQAALQAAVRKADTSFEFGANRRPGKSGS